MDQNDVQFLKQKRMEYLTSLATFGSEIELWDLSRFIKIINEMERENLKLSQKLQPHENP